MPTNEEEMAIMNALVVLLHIRDGRWTAVSNMKKEGTTEKTFDTLYKYLKKVEKQKQKLRDNANKWNMENYEKHKEHNKRYVENNKEKVKARQHEYYKQRKDK